MGRSYSSGQTHQSTRIGKDRAKSTHDSTTISSPGNPISRLAVTLLIAAVWNFLKWLETECHRLASSLTAPIALFRKSANFP